MLRFTFTFGRFFRLRYDHFVINKTHCNTMKNAVELTGLAEWSVGDRRGDEALVVVLVALKRTQLPRISGNSVQPYTGSLPIRKIWTIFCSKAMTLDAILVMTCVRKENWHGFDVWVIVHPAPRSSFRPYAQPQRKSSKPDVLPQKLTIIWHVNVVNG